MNVLNYINYMKKQKINGRYHLNCRLCGSLFLSPDSWKMYCPTCSYKPANTIRTDNVLEIISMKLFSEGVSAKNYNTTKALLLLRNCVAGRKLMSYLLNYENEIKNRLEILSQNKQINATEF